MLAIGLVACGSSLYQQSHLFAELSTTNGLEVPVNASGLC
jgi:hypothetical protein